MLKVMGKIIGIFILMISFSGILLKSEEVAKIIDKMSNGSSVPVWKD